MAHSSVHPVNWDNSNPALQPRCSAPCPPRFWEAWVRWQSWHYGPGSSWNCIHAHPNPTSPRTKPPETRRDELMNAAERLFLSEGVAATTIEQITSAAAVAKGTFYLYFSSKDDVLDRKST